VKAPSHLSAVRSQQTLAEAQAIARLDSWELDVTTDVMVWSDELSRFHGHSPDLPPSPSDLLERFHPGDAALFRAFLGAAIAGHGAFGVDHRIFCPTGRPDGPRSQGRVDLDGAGVAFHMHGTAQDITDQRSAEDALVRAPGVVVAQDRRSGHVRGETSVRARRSSERRPKRSGTVGADGVPRAGSPGRGRCSGRTPVRGAYRRRCSR
jgi:hypothetical protein